MGGEKEIKKWFRARGIEEGPWKGRKEGERRERESGKRELGVRRRVW